MKVFHELAFEGYVLAVTPNIFSDPRLMELLGAVDTLHVSGYAAQVTGTGPTVSIFEQYSNDRSIWYNTFVTPVVNAVALSTSGETLFQGLDPFPGMARFGYSRLQIAVNPSDAKAFLRIWVTGRDLSRRSATPAASSNAPPVPTPMKVMPAPTPMKAMPPMAGSQYNLKG